MNGPEHYRQAEVLLSNSRDRIGGDLKAPLLHPPEQRAEMLAWAQVHATLALAALTWEVAQDEPLHRYEWAEATT